MMVWNWAFSGNFWQGRWENFLEIVGDDPYILWGYGPTIISISLYWILGIFYTLLDLYNKPSIIKRYKTQPGKNQPVDKNRLFKVIGWVLFNQLLKIPLGLITYKAMTWRTYPDIRVLPSFNQFLIDFSVFAFVEEVLFYCIHRLLHHKTLYKYTHKMHHEWTAPIAVTALYAHPIDFVATNIFPVFFGVFLMGSHILTACIWYGVGVFVALHTHSGYHFPFLPSPEYHDYHHINFNQNYGMIGILDWIVGTDAQFRKTEHYKRHRITYSFVPPKERHSNLSYSN